jgi:hypothetical protein
MPDSAEQKTALHFPATIVLINMIKRIYLKGHHIPKTNILPVRTFRPHNKQSIKLNHVNHSIKK